MDSYFCLPHLLEGGKEGEGGYRKTRGYGQVEQKWFMARLQSGADTSVVGWLKQNFATFRSFFSVHSDDVVDLMAARVLTAAKAANSIQILFLSGTISPAKEDATRQQRFSAVTRRSDCKFITLNF